MIQSSGSSAGLTRHNVASLRSVHDTAEKAEFEAAIECQRCAEAFLIAQTVAKDFPDLPVSEQRAKVVVQITSGILSEASDTVVRNELTWTKNDDYLLEKFSRLTPLDDNELLGESIEKAGNMSPRDWIWAHRYHCCAASSKMLAKFLKVVDWCNHTEVRKLGRLCPMADGSP